MTSAMFAFRSATFSGRDTMKHLYATRPPMVNIQFAAGANPNQFASVEPLWPLREHMWPLARAALDRAGHPAAARALEASRREAEARGPGRFDRHAKVLSYPPNTRELQRTAKVEAWKGNCYQPG